MSQVVLMGDVVQKRQALEVLMSYNPFWLRLAAEVVTQKPVQMQGEWLGEVRASTLRNCECKPQPAMYHRLR
jgi:hypothetical protein